MGRCDFDLPTFSARCPESTGREFVKKTAPKNWAVACQASVIDRRRGAQ